MKQNKQIFATSPYRGYVALNQYEYSMILSKYNTGLIGLVFVINVYALSRFEILNIYIVHMYTSQTV